MSKMALSQLQLPAGITHADRPRDLAVLLQPTSADVVLVLETYGVWAVDGKGAMLDVVEYRSHNTCLLCTKFQP